MTPTQVAGARKRLSPGRRVVSLTFRRASAPRASAAGSALPFLREAFAFGGALGAALVRFVFDALTIASANGCGRSEAGRVLRSICRHCNSPVSRSF
jgi:hypothetical protein